MWILGAYVPANEVKLFSFFAFDNVWVLIHALEGFYKHVGIGICSFQVTYLFHLLSKASKSIVLFSCNSCF